jgi:16S rRNA processing protein RimM
MAFFCFDNLTTLIQFFLLFFFAMSMIPVGRLHKTFGAHGELLLTLYGDSPELSQKAPVFISVDGLEVPFYIKSITHKNGRFVVVFDDMECEALAQELVGKEVFIEKAGKRNAAASPADDELMLGYTFEDAELGVIGKFTQRFDYPGNPVLQLTTEQGKEILIPDNPRFILSVDKKRKTVSVSLPEGLIEVYMQ